VPTRDESGRSRHEDEVKSLNAQISFLDEEIAVLRRRLADSPRQVRMLEDRLRGHWLVSECLVVGDAKPYIGMLVATDPEAFTLWKADHGKPETAGIADLHDDPALRAEIQAAIDDVNKAVSHAEAIKKFVILGEEFTETGGQLTPTLKVRRYVITEQYAAQIAGLYEDAS